MNKGKLIIFEGMECCGKGTQIEKLINYLEKNNKEIIIAKEPGQTEAGKIIRELLLQTEFKINPNTQMLLFNACRSDIYDKIIIPGIENGKYIIQDRSWPSTIAYQVFAGGLDLYKTEQIIQFATHDIVPDLVIYLYIPIEKYPETFKERIERRNETLNSFEKNNMDYFSKVFEGYEYLYNKNKETWIKIDALKSIEEIHDQIAREIQTRFN